MRKIVRLSIAFFKALWRLVKSMKTAKGLLALTISFAFWFGASMLVFSITLQTSNLLVLIPSSILFWNTPLTPFMLFVIGTAVFIQKIILRDNKAMSKEEIINNFKGGS